MIGEASMDVLVKKTSSPSFHYNLAVLESFQRRARKAELPLGFTDPQHEVIIMGGSMGKGTGHFWSDFDIVDVTDNQKNDPKWLYQFTKDIPREYEVLIREDKRFTPVKKYTAIASELIKRNHVMSKRLIEADPLYQKMKTEKLTPDEGFTMIANSMSNSTKTKDRSNRNIAIAERASKVIDNVGLEVPRFPHLVSDRNEPGDYEIVQWTTDTDIAGILGGKTDERYQGLLLILSSTPGVNAFEVTSGNLRHHQIRMVNSLRQLHDSDAEAYHNLHNQLKNEWRTYIGQTPTKYPSFYKEIVRSRANKPYGINSFFDFEEFPEIDQLEKFFGINTDNQELLNKKN
jgi:hypothetical protein